MVQSDVRTVRLLAELAQQINYKWNSSEKILPSNLDGLPDSKKQDPVTKKSFGFHRKADSNYELCATFATDNREVQASNSEDHWTHPKGDYCFEFDASQQVPNVPYYY